MFTSGNYEPSSSKHRYLIKHEGNWKIIQTWATTPDWDDDVTDVIWLKNPVSMIASWWQMKDGIRSSKRGVERVTDEELAFLLLQVEI